MSNILIADDTSVNTDISENENHSHTTDNYSTETLYKATGAETDAVDFKVGLLHADHNTCKKGVVIDGKFEVIAPGAIGRGTYQTKEIKGLIGYAQLLANFPQDAVLTLGHCREATGLISFGKKGSEKGSSISRSKKYIDYQPGIKLVLIDVDTKGWPKRYEPQEVMDLLTSVCSAFKGVGYVVTDSSSAYIEGPNGETVRGKGNYHIAFLFDGDVEKLKEHLIDAFQLHGHVAPRPIKNSKTGNYTFRRAFPIDMTVLSGERLVYEAWIDLSGAPGHKKLFTAPRYVPGTILRGDEIPKLTPAQVVQGRNLWKAMRHDAQEGEVLRRVAAGETMEAVRLAMAIENAGYIAHDTMLYREGGEPWGTVGKLYDLYWELEWEQINNLELCCTDDPGYDAGDFPQKSVVSATEKGLFIIDQGHGGALYRVADPECMVLEGDSAEKKNAAKRQAEINRGVMAVKRLTTVQYTHQPIGEHVDFEWVSDAGVPIPALGHATGIGASLGRGKTVAIIKMVKDMIRLPEKSLTIILVPRNSLARNITLDLNAPNEEGVREMDAKWFNDQEIKDGASIVFYDVVTGCIEGADKFFKDWFAAMDAGYKINLILDEGDQVLESLHIGGTLKHQQIKRMRTIGNLAMMLERIGQGEGRLIVAEANLSRIAIDCIDILSSGKIVMHVWDCRGDGSLYKRDCYIAMDGSKSLKAACAHRIETLLKAGEKVYVNTGSKMFGKQLEIMFAEQFVTKRIDQNNVASEDSQIVLKDVKDYCKRNGVQLFIGSPSISTGISIKAGWFTVCVGYGGNVNYRNAYQGSQRVRDDIPYSAFVLEIGRGSPIVWPDLIERDWATSEEVILGLHGLKIEPHELISRAKRIAALYKAADNGGARYQRALLTDMLKADGHRIYKLQPTDAEDCKAMSARLSAAELIIEDEKIASYQMAERISIADARTAKEKGEYKDSDHYLSVIKTIWAEEYPDLYDKEWWIRKFYASSKSAQNWKEAREEATMANPELVKAVDKSWLEAYINNTETVWTPDLDNKLAGLEWLKSCGLDIVLEEASTVGVWKGSESLTTFMEACMLDPTKCSLFLRLRDRERSKTSVVKFFGIVCDFLGLERQRSETRNPPISSRVSKGGDLPVSNDLINTNRKVATPKVPIYKIPPIGRPSPMAQQIVDNAERDLQAHNEQKMKQPLPPQKKLPKLQPEKDNHFVQIDMDGQTEYVSLLALTDGSVL